jgi:hypothetical protein
MNRGVISLTAEQRNLLGKLCGQFPDTPTPELITRLQAATQYNTSATSPDNVIALELTEESAESALDLLPIPSLEEPDTVASLRAAFHSFLLEMRGGA